MTFYVNSWASLDGFIEPAEGQFLYDEALSLPCGSNILEIGCYHGKSTIALLCACKDSNCSERKRVLSVDYFAGQGMYETETSPSETAFGIETVNRVITEWGLNAWFIGLAAMKSEAWLSQHSEFHGKIDMLFLDGLHLIADQDLAHAMPYFHPGSVVICHDFWPLGHYLDWITKKILSSGLDFVRLGNTNLGKAVIK